MRTKVYKLGFNRGNNPSNDKEPSSFQDGQGASNAQMAEVEPSKSISDNKSAEDQGTGPQMAFADISAFDNETPVIRRSTRSTRFTGSLKEPGGTPRARRSSGPVKVR